MALYVKVAWLAYLALARPGRTASQSDRTVAQSGLVCLCRRNPIKGDQAAWQHGWLAGWLGRHCYRLATARSNLVVEP